MEPLPKVRAITGRTDARFACVEPVEYRPPWRSIDRRFLSPRSQKVAMTARKVRTSPPCPKFYLSAFRIWNRVLPLKRRRDMLPESTVVEPPLPPPPPAALSA